MKGIVDNESLAVIPQKLIKEFLAGLVHVPGDVQQTSKIFLASDLPGISDLQNPELLTVGFYVTTSTAQPTGQDRFVVSGKTTINATTKNTVPSQPITPGAVVKLAQDAVYYNGKDIPAWVKNTNWIVSSMSGDRVVINSSQDGKYKINSPVNIRFLSVVSNTNKPAEAQKTSAFTPYKSTGYDKRIKHPKCARNQKHHCWQNPR